MSLFLHGIMTVVNFSALPPNSLYNMGLSSLIADDYSLFCLQPNDYYSLKRILASLSPILTHWWLMRHTFCKIGEWFVTENGFDFTLLFLNILHTVVNAVLVLNPYFSRKLIFMSLNKLFILKISWRIRLLNISKVFATIVLFCGGAVQCSRL